MERAPETGAAGLEALRDLSVGRMQGRKLPVAERLRGAYVALAACEAKHRLGVTDALTAAAERERVRAYAVLEFGPVEGDALRDPRSVLAGVTEAIGAGPGDLARLADGWQRRTPEEMRHLRRVKNLVAVLRDVQGELPSDRAEVESWVSLLPRLP